MRDTYRIAGVVLLALSFGLRADRCGDKDGEDSGMPAGSTTGSTTGTTTGTTGSTTGTTGTGTGVATGTATGTGTGTGGVSDCSGNLCIHYDPAAMMKSHTVGVSGCPDPLGVVEIENNSPDDASYQFTGPPVQPAYVPGVIFLEPGSTNFYAPLINGTVPAGTSEFIEFFFSCYTTTSFADDVLVDISTPSDLLVTTVPVEMTIQ